MADPNQFRLRAVFAKRGRLAMLSHLEVAHALERAVRRADLPFAISQGFSPHMKIAFGAALPVGVGGDCEIFDLQLLERVPEEEALARLQDASVPDLMVLSVRYIDPHAKAASVAFPVSQYAVQLSFAPVALPVPEEVVVVRKKKEKRLVVADFLAEPMRLDGTRLTFALEARATGSLRPDKLLQACLELYNQQAGVASPRHATGDMDSMSRRGGAAAGGVVGSARDAAGEGARGAGVEVRDAVAPTDAAVAQTADAAAAPAAAAVDQAAAGRSEAASAAEPATAGQHAGVVPGQIAVLEPAFALLPNAGVVQLPQSPQPLTVVTCTRVGQR